MVQRIGLLTLPLETNYGGILQAVSLYQYLTAAGKEVVFLETHPPESRRRRAVLDALAHVPFLPSLTRLLAKRPEGARGPLARSLSSGLLARLRANAEIVLFERKAALHLPFRHRFITRRSGPLSSSQALADAVERFKLDALVVGSDQVWRLDYLPPDLREDFFFRFAPDPAVRKVSYAASFGRGEWLFPEAGPAIAALLARFHAVSVREASGVTICADVLGRGDARHVLDPTMLIDTSFFDTASAPPLGRTGKTLLSYVLDEEPDRPFVSREVHAALGEGYTVRSLTLDDGKAAVDVPGWLRAYMDADFVVTDSYHGTVFSILFQKNFIAILNRSRGADRFVSLLGQLGLSDRLVMDPTPETLHALARTPVDFAPVAARLKELRAQSAAFLHEALA
ncbi:polysaccharide pyruvyl transferase family protein [Ancylobacter terrae]|uniref:polysaccharide pyruvyl transferase family protein n=1 Tax=Ancylobacter sp. sgz301288 TaxID=3342077 RepID=UPI0038582FEB